MTIEELAPLAIAARLHAANAQADIQFASTRVEHIRLTALAIEAATLARNIETLLNRAQEPEYEESN